MTTTTPASTTQYRVSWRVIETHEVILTAARLAEILGITVEELLATPAGEVEYLGTGGGLADGLAEADDEDEHELIEFNRDNIEVEIFEPDPGEGGQR